MGRKPDPNTRYRVRIRKDRKYTYASVQERKVSPRTGKRYHKIVNLGTLDENLAFTPNATFRLMTPEERAKYIFPDNWDISKLKDLCHQIPEKVTVNDLTNGGRAMSIPDDTVFGRYSDKMYGAFWLLEQVARGCGLYDDLLKTFGGNIFKTNEVISLAFFPYLSGQNYERFAKWQVWNRTLLDYELNTSAIMKLAESITDSDRMNLIKLRIARWSTETHSDCASSMRLAWGRFLVDIRSEKNTVEVVGYSLGTQEPIYYRNIPGNISDMSMVRAILADLEALGITDAVFIMNMEYVTRENISALVLAGIPFLVCSKTCTYPVVDLLEDIAYDENGLPVGMGYDPALRLYYSQESIPLFTGELPDGTPVETDKMKANLFMDIGDRMQELCDLRQAIETERAKLKNAVEKNLVPDSIQKYNTLFDYFKVTLKMDDDGKPVGIQYEECLDKIRKEKATCGFFASLMHGAGLTPCEVLQAYRERDEIIQQSSCEGEKNGMAFILFVGLVVISKLRNAWRSSLKDDYVSTLDMLDEMAPIRFCEYADGSGHMTPFTTKQVMISRACNVEPPSECIPLIIQKPL